MIDLENESFVSVKAYNVLGQLSVSRIRLEQQLNDLDQAENDVRSQFTENQSTERDFVDTISKKYGKVGLGRLF